MKTRVVDDKMVDGRWLRTYVCDGEQLFTRAYKLWNNMKQRCRHGGALQENRPTYLGCTVGANFQDYQFFAEWCQTQVGYGAIGFELEKDLLFKGNKEYSETTCLFLPQRINKFLLKSQASRGDCPIGVYFSPVNNGYVALSNDGQGRKAYIGTYATAAAAFEGYRSFKRQLATELALAHQDVIDPRAVKALIEYDVEISD